MLRVVVHTSPLISYALARAEAMGRVVAHWRAEDFVLLTSPSTRAELAEGLAHPSDSSPLSLNALVQGLEHFSEPVAGTLASQEPAPDPRDDGVLARAVEGEAHYLVSSDPRLLDIRRYEEVCIVNPGQFLLAYNRPSCRRRR